jgi:hypothetical protein
VSSDWELAASTLLKNKESEPEALLEAACFRWSISERMIGVDPFSAWLAADPHLDSFLTQVLSQCPAKLRTALAKKAGSRLRSRGDAFAELIKEHNLQTNTHLATITNQLLAASRKLPKLASKMGKGTGTRHRHISAGGGDKAEYFVSNRKSNRPQRVEWL